MFVCCLLDNFLPILVYKSFKGATLLSDCLTGLYTSAGPLRGYCIPCPRLITWDDNRKEAWLTQCCNARCGVRYTSYRVPSNSAVSSQHVSIGGMCCRSSVQRPLSHARQTSVGPRSLGLVNNIWNQSWQSDASIATITAARITNFTPPAAQSPVPGPLLPPLALS
jgi:hypothetical protein